MESSPRLSSFTSPHRPATNMIAGGNRAMLSLLIVGLLILTGAALLPVAQAQGICENGPAPPCIEPEVEISSPQCPTCEAETVKIPVNARTGQGTLRSSFSLNVSYASDAPGDETTTVTVEPRPLAEFTITGGSSSVVPGDTVSIPVDIEVSMETAPGARTLALWVNTTGTNTHTPTAQEISTQLFMPTWGDVQIGSVWGIGGGLHADLQVHSLTSNVPLDLLVTVTNDTHRVDPEILPTSDQWSRNAPISGEWHIRFSGGSGFTTFHIWPVIPVNGGLACLHHETGDPIPFDDRPQEDACQKVHSSSIGTTGQIGGWTGTLLLVAMGLLIMGMVGAIVLGAFVLRRGGNQPPAHALGIYLLLAGTSFGLVALYFLLQELFGFGVAQSVLGEWVIILMFLMLGALATAILIFALSYPTVLPRLQSVRFWIAFPVTPFLAITAYLAIRFIQFGGFRPDLLLFTLTLGYLTVAVLLAGLLLWHRARIAATRLEKRRILFLQRAVILPLAALAALMFIIVLMEMLDMIQVPFVIIQFTLAALAFLPVSGLALGLLRYRIVDLNTKIRITINRGFIGAVFIGVFFLVTEAAKLLFSATIGPIVGLLAAALLVAAIAPLERVGRRLASRVVPEPPDPEAYQSFRRLEIYRAAYEEVAVDDQVTDKERRAMDSLARSLKLSNDEVSFVETEVKKERKALAQTKQGPTAIAL